jgi:hypothetical protein
MASREEKRSWRAEFKQLRAPEVKKRVEHPVWSGEKTQEAYDWLDEQQNRYARRAHWIAVAALIISIVSLLLSTEAVRLLQLVLPAD